jgi:transposase-like protein
MGCSRLPYSKWLMAIYFVVNHKRGISSLQLARNLGIQQANAWFMIQRIFNIVNSDNNILSGTVEMDEVYIGGAEKNKRPNRKTLNHNKIDGDKISVLGMLERGGKVILRQYSGKQYKHLSPIIENHIATDATVYTDESPLYKGGINGRTHDTVNHNQGIYGRGDITTNRIEGIFSHLKRMILGTHAFVTRGHFKAYADMFSFRMDTRELSEFQRLALLVAQMNGTRIMYEQVSCHGNPGTNKWFPKYGSKRKIVL